MTDANTNGTITPPKSRNDPCPCGSGKRYKSCHGLIAAAPATPQEPTDASKPTLEQLMQAGLAAHQAQKLTEAAALYDQALAIEPNQPDVLHMRGVVALTLSHPYEARALIQRAMAEGLNNQAVQHNLTLAEDAVHTIEVLPEKIAALEHASTLIATDEDPLIAPSDVQLLCYYLPQFHRVAENDEWWGLGFTEWSNVRKAKPIYPGHDQPRVPTTLGYYDLVDPNTRARQADLARAHGITGFCYYHYWFHGKRILEKPLDALLASGTPDFPFCVFWANESWQKTWDGGNQEILMRQEHDALDDMAFIRHLLPMFNDKRYIRVRGQPLLMVYRVDNLPAAAETFERWREACIRHHELPPFIVVADTRYEGSALAFGADASVGFPPHRLSAQAMRASDIASDPSFSGNLLDYRSVAATLATQTESDHLRFQCVVPRWDNTARRQFDGTVFAHSSPQRFEAWLRDALVRARDDLPAGQRFVFINAWNEWAEGAYLEPDAHFGDAYLKAALRARHVPIGYRRIGQATK